MPSEVIWSTAGLVLMLHLKQTSLAFLWLFHVAGSDPLVWRFDSQQRPFCGNQDGQNCCNGRMQPVRMLLRQQLCKCPDPPSEVIFDET